MEKIFRITDDDNNNNNIAVYHCSTQGTASHWHDFYELELCLSGEGMVNINESEYMVSPGTLQLVTPNDFHKYHSINGRIELVKIVFHSSCSESTGFSYILANTGYIISNLNENQQKHLLYLIETLEKEYQKKDYLSNQYSIFILHCILIELFRLNDQTVNFYENNNHVQKILYYLKHHFKEPITQKDVAEYVHLSTSYVSKIFKENLGCGFKQFLLNLRLMHAENLLLNSDETITDISYFCGFNSTTHFIKAFKSKYNMSPKKFRKSSSVFIDNENKKSNP